MSRLHFIPAGELLAEVRRRGYDVRMKLDKELSYSRAWPDRNRTMDDFRIEAMKDIRAQISVEHLRFEEAEYAPPIFRSKFDDEAMIPNKIVTGRLLLW